MTSEAAPERTRAGAGTNARAWRSTALSILGGTAFLAWFARIGADYDWLVALGDHIRRTGAVPGNVPFAAAPSDGWRDVPVLAQLIASWAAPLGDGFVVWLHVLAITATLVIVALCARREGASDSATAGSLVALVAGGLTAFVVVRLQTFSYVPFALLVALVMSEHRRPSRRIWLAPVLIAVWGNLHGAVLLGVCVLGAYLLLARLGARPVETLTVGLVSVLALLMTPQLRHTPDYYWSVLHNEAAARGEGMWGSPSLENPLDVVLILAVLALLLALAFRRRPAWTYVAVLGLLVATAVASRNGVWLLLLLASAAPAGRAATRGDPVSTRTAAVTLVAVGGLVATPLLASRSLSAHEVDGVVVHAVVRQAGEGVVLAPSPLAESLAVRGVTVWVANPIDAFRQEDQAAYLDFLAGRPGMSRAVDAADLVVTAQGTPADRRMQGAGGWVSEPCSEGWICHVRS